MINKTIKTILFNYGRILQNYPNKSKRYSEIEELLCHVLNVPKTFLYTWPEKILNTEDFEYFKKLFAKYISGIPLPYILGKKEFWKLNLIVNKHTLIPRYDTELIIEIILKKFKKEQSNLHVLDLGTGSGAIALNLAYERPNWCITATDISVEALKVSMQNKYRHNLRNVDILHGNWYSPVAKRKFDIIVSNPPYVDKDDVALCNDVLQYEPKNAVISDDDGLCDIKHIISKGYTHLKHNGFIVIEHGFKQAQKVYDIFKYFKYHNIQNYTDLSGHQRATSAMYTL